MSYWKLYWLTAMPSQLVQLFSGIVFLRVACGSVLHLLIVFIFFGQSHLLFYDTITISSLTLERFLPVCGFIILRRLILLSLLIFLA